MVAQPIVWLIFVVCGYTADTTGELVEAERIIRRDHVAGISTHPNREECSRIWLTNSGGFYVYGSPRFLLERFLSGDVLHTLKENEHEKN